jgi:hypothetical protein
MAVKIACVVFDCSEALTVGRFWSAAIDRALDPEADSSFASIGFHGRRDKEGWGVVERDRRCGGPDRSPRPTRSHPDRGQE